MSSKVVVDLVGRDQQLQAVLKSAEGGLKGFSSRAVGLASSVKGAWAAVGTALAAVGAGLAIRSVLASAKETLDLYAEQEAAEKKLEAVLKATGYAAGWTAEQMKALAAARQEVTTFGDEATIAVQAVLATFKEIKGDVFTQAITAIQDMATVMDSDLKGAAIQLGKALNDPIKGVSALAEVGVSFTDAQREQIKALMETGRIMEAQRVILAELNSEFGGAAVAAADTYRGKMQQLNNVLGDAKEMIGGELAPVLQEAAKRFLDWAKEGDNLKRSMESALGAVETLGSSALNKVQELYQGFVALQYGINATIAETAKLMAMIDGLANKGGSNLFNMLLPGGAGIASLLGTDQMGGGLKAFSQEMDRVMKDVKTRFDSAFSGDRWADALAGLGAASAGSGSGGRPTSTGSGGGLPSEAKDQAKKTQEVIAELRNEIDRFSMDEPTRKVAEFLDKIGKSVPQGFKWSDAFEMPESTVREYAAMAMQLESMKKSHEAIKEATKKRDEGFKGAQGMFQEWSDKAYQADSGATDRQMKIRDAMRGGMDPRIAAALQEADRRLSAAEKRQEDREKGKQLTEKYKSPAEQLKEQLAEAFRLFQQGDINRQTLGNYVDVSKKESMPKSEAFKAGYDDLTGLYKRIQSSAASDPQERSARAAEDMAMKMNEWKTIFGTVKEQLASIDTTLKTELPHLPRLH